MEIESVKCECCGLKEDCTQEYIRDVKAKFDSKWLCGLCSEAVRDEVNRAKRPFAMEEAVKAHMSFCGKIKSNPAVRVADGMRQMLRRRSTDLSSSSSKYSGRSNTTSQVTDSSTFPLHPWKQRRLEVGNRENHITLFSFRSNKSLYLAFCG